MNVPSRPSPTAVDSPADAAGRSSDPARTPTLVPPWAQQLLELGVYLLEQGPCDLADDWVMSRPELAWARRQQQQGADKVPAELADRLTQLPGWCWRTRVDQLRDGDLPGLRVLAHQSRNEQSVLAKVLHVLPVSSVARMSVADDPAAVRVNAALRAAAQPAVHDQGVRLDTLMRLLPVEQRNEAAAARLVALLGSLGDEEGNTLIRALLLPQPHVSAVFGPAPLVAVDDLLDEDISPASVGDAWVASDTFMRVGRRHVATLHLSARTHNVLVREGLTRICDVMAIEDPTELLRLRGFGVTCLDNLRERLVENGLTPLF